MLDSLAGILLFLAQKAQVLLVLPQRFRWPNLLEAEVSLLWHLVAGGYGCEMNALHNVLMRGQKSTL